VLSGIGIGTVWTMTTPSPLVSSDPSFAELFPPDVALEHLAGDFTWAEGPTYVAMRERVVFSDVRQNRTWAWTDQGRLELEEDPSHHQNGHCTDADGLLIACSHGERALVRQESDGSWTTLADSFEGKRLNSPNDVALHPGDGSLWFTDPTYGIDKPEEGYGGTQELEGRWVFRLDRDGTLTAPIRDRHKPNGLAFASEDLLLLADTGDDAATHGYRIDADGNATYEREWFRVDPGKTDGLRLDIEGRIWSSAADGVHVLTPDGSTELGRIPTPEVTANLCFGGPYGTLLYLTATSSLWRIPTRTRGLELRR